MTKYLDAFGSELKVGDTVAFVTTSTVIPLALGEILALTKEPKIKLKILSSYYSNTYGTPAPVRWLQGSPEYSPTIPTGNFYFKKFILQPTNP